MTVDGQIAYGEFPVVIRARLRLEHWKVCYFGGSAYDRWIEFADGERRVSGIRVAEIALSTKLESKETVGFAQVSEDIVEESCSHCGLDGGCRRK